MLLLVLRLIHVSDNQSLTLSNSPIDPATMSIFCVQDCIAGAGFEAMAPTKVELPGAWPVGSEEEFMNSIVKGAGVEVLRERLGLIQRDTSLRCCQSHVLRSQSFPGVREIRNRIPQGVSFL
jgi:hypothetical protein